MTTSNGNEGRLLEEAQRIVDRAYQRIKVDRHYRRLSTTGLCLAVPRCVTPLAAGMAACKRAIRPPTWQIIDCQNEALVIDK